MKEGKRKRKRKRVPSNFVGLVLLTLVSCQYKPDIPADFDPKGKLVFVEDVDGEDGLYSYDFGDIVILDPKTGEKVLITRDKYFDSHPSWSPSGQKILFESRRVGGRDNNYDLSDPKHVFEFDFKSLTIDQIDKDWIKKFNGIVGEENSFPIYSNSGTFISFGTEEDFMNENVVIYNISMDSIYPIKEKKDLWGALIWSDDDKYLAYSVKHMGTDRLDAISIEIIDSQTGKLVKKISQRKWYYDLGDLYKNRLLYYGHELAKDARVKLFIYDMVSKVTEEVYEFDMRSINDPLFVNDHEICFIGCDQDDGDYRTEDIFRLNLKTNELSRLTHDGHHKMDLSLLR